MKKTILILVALAVCLVGCSGGDNGYGGGKLTAVQQKSITDMEAIVKRANMDWTQLNEADRTRFIKEWAGGNETDARSDFEEMAARLREEATAKQ